MTGDASVIAYHVNLTLHTQYLGNEWAPIAGLISTKI